MTREPDGQHAEHGKGSWTQCLLTARCTDQAQINVNAHPTRLQSTAELPAKKARCTGTLTAVTCTRSNIETGARARCWDVSATDNLEWSRVL
jgi:hypothetical protein